MKKLIILTALSSTVFLGACSILNRPIDEDPITPGNVTVSIEARPQVTEFVDANSLVTGLIENIELSGSMGIGGIDLSIGTVE